MTKMAIAVAANMPVITTVPNTRRDAPPDPVATHSGAVPRMKANDVITDAAALNGREIDLAGDVRTMREAAEILTGALGRPIAFAQTPIEQVRQFSKDTATMLEWFERVGYSADIAGLEREFGRALTKLPDWARGQTRGERT